MKTQMKFVAPVFAAFAALAVAGAAEAGGKGGGGCGHSCQPPKPKPPKPPCCKPPTPPKPTPPVNVNVHVNASAEANAYARSSASASAFAFVGGGSSNWSNGLAAQSVVNNLAVVGAQQAIIRKVPFEAKRRMEKTVVIQAVCIDDRFVAHAASQISPDRDVLESYTGELYRCVAGSRLQVTIADWHGKVSFDGGTTMDCRKGEALWYSAGGKLECRPASKQRDCYERSLLRRFGAGIKILRYVREETYTEWREEVVQAAGACASTCEGSLALDGGVGGMVY